MNNSIAINNQQLNIQKKSHAVFLLMLGIFILLIFARGVAGISFPVAILLGWFSLTALIADREELFALCLACIPTAVAFQYKYAIFIWIAIYAVKYKSDINFNSCAIPLVLMLVWELLHQFFYDDSLTEIIRRFAELILLTFIMCLKKRDMNYDFIFRVYGYTACLIVVFVLINVLRSNNYNLNGLFESGYYRFGKGSEDGARYSLDFNPNGLASHCNCAIIALMLLRYMKKQTAIDYAAIVILVIIGALSISRSFILTCACIFLVFALLGNKTGKGRIMSILTIGFIGMAVWFLVANYLPAVYDSFVDRFSANDITGGRAGLLDVYDEHIYSSWKYSLFGLGFINVATKMNQIYGLVTMAPHSGFQELVVVWGYPGLCMFISMLICMIHSAGKGKKGFVFANFIPLIFALGTAMAGQLITAGYKLFMLSFAYMALSIEFSKEEEKNE